MRALESQANDARDGRQAAADLEALKLRDAVLKAISEDARGLSYDLLGVLARIRTRRRIVREALRPALLEARKQLDALVRDA